jgi:hypothetical protein
MLVGNYRITEDIAHIFFQPSVTTVKKNNIFREDTSDLSVWIKEKLTGKENKQA